MIKIKRFINPAGLNKLEQIIDKRRISKSNNIPVVLKILKDIRSNKISREVGVKEVIKRDHVKPKDLYRWLKYVGWTEEKFDFICDTFRDPRVWWIKDNHWAMKAIDGKIFTHGKVLLDKSEWSKYYIE